MYRTSWLALLAATGVFAPISAHAQFAPPRVEVEMLNGNGSSLAGGLFVPYVLDGGTVLFADGWLSYDVDGPLYGSVGAGIRHQVGDWVLGANASFDFANSPYDFNYQQISAGLEALSNQYEFRINGYAPIGETSNKVNALSTVAIRNGSFIANQGYEVALYGLDAEAGIRLPVFDEDSVNSLKVYAGAYVKGSEHAETVAGVSLRTEVTLSLDQHIPGATVSLGAGVRYDSRDELSGSVLVRFAAPIGGVPTAAQAKSPLFQRVERNRAITTKAGNFGSDQAAFAGNGSSRVVQVSEGAASSLNAKIAAAGEGAIILASGTIVVDQTIGLATNQMFVGGGGVINLKTNDGQQFNYVNPGAATTLAANQPAPGLRVAAPVEVDAIRMANGSTISTLSITGSHDAIVAEGVKNIAIDNVSISGVSGNGIVLTSVQGGSITNSTIRDTKVCVGQTLCEFKYASPSDVPNTAIKAIGVQDFTISNIEMSNVEYGIFLSSRLVKNRDDHVITEQAQNIRVSNVNITNSRREGVFLVSATDVHMNNLRIDNSALDRSMDLVVFQRSGNSSLSNATLIGGVNSLMFVNASTLPGATQNIDIRDVNLFNPSNTNVFINGGVENVRFANVLATGAGAFGMYLYGDYETMNSPDLPVSGIDFKNFVIERPKMAGVFFMGPVENLTGAIQTRDTKTPCMSYTDFTQSPGKSLLLNGTALTPANIDNRC